MSSEQVFDVVVIGSGPGGEGAAMNAAKHHKKVALVERHMEVGGGCTHWGTIPSRRCDMANLHALRSNPCSKKHSALHLTFPQILANAACHRNSGVGAPAFLRTQSHSGIRRSSCFVDANTLEVQSARAVTRVQTICHCRLVLSPARTGFHASSHSR
jgi:NAD(P) transhydrogenase